MEIGNVFLDKYLIQQILGSGGMGSVYLACELNSQKQCAIKVEHITSENRELLESEVQIMQRLQYPAFPKIWQIHVDAENYYIVMDYVEGTTLSELLKTEKRFEEARVLKWFGQVCDILIYLHGLDKPVVYRDFKPSNIMIDPEDNVKLIDFGISQEYQQDTVSDKKYLTLTKGYAAPEQYDIRYRSDVRTDIYALGVTMHYLLTGKNPKEPPFHFTPVRRLNPAASRAMESIIKKCIQPNPDKRYEDAVSLRKDLQNISEINQRLRNRIIIRVLVFLCIALAAAAVLIGIFLTAGESRTNQIAAYYTLLEEADVREEEGAVEEAKLLIQEAIDMQPEAEDAYLQMAEMYRINKEYTACFQYISEKILPAFPNIYDNVNFLGLMGHLYSEQNQYEDALFYYETRYEMMPENMDYLFELTLCHIQSKRKNEAEGNIQKLEEEAYDLTLIQELRKLISM